MARHPPLALALALLTAVAATPSSTKQLLTPTTTTTPTPVPAACVSLPQSSLGRAACDVTTPGGPWVVIQSRTHGNVPFNRKWATYSAGFGHVDGDYWLGLDAIHHLCPPARPCQLRVDVSYHGGACKWNCVPRQPDGRYHSLYGRFAVADRTDLYRLTIGLYNATVSTGGDYLSRTENDQVFHTVDVDRDTWNGKNSCSAQKGGAGWWFSYNCGASLNGRWGAGGYQGPVWGDVTGYASAASTRMMVRVAA